MTTDTSSWRTAYAQGWAETVITGLGTTYPYAAQHVSLGPDDVDVTPDRLHPAFHGCFDWHSSVHMQWSAVQLLDRAAERLQADTRAALVAVLDERLTAKHCQQEASYLRRHPSFERPYGWAWIAQLAAATSSGAAPHAPAWAAAMAPLLDVVVDLVVDWLPRVAYPVRSGEHSNVAFAMLLLHDAAIKAGRTDLRDAVGARAHEWFDQDTGYPVQWEPGGSDFLSPALCEAALMQRVTHDPSRYAEWLADFLPHLGEAGDPLLGPPSVLDRNDGKAVHLFGLALSRAWQLRRCAPALPEDRRARIAEATERQVAHVQREIVAGDFMSTHWLVSFALLAADG